MTIAITGATGQLGRLVVEKLKEKVPAADLVALVRSPAKASSLGVTYRDADYAKPDTLDRALAGVDALLLISSNEIGQRAAQHRNVISAARKAGVKRIVYTSLLHADTSSLSLAGEHRETEKDLQTAGAAFTILRNGWYTENYTGSIGAALTSGAVIGSAGEGRISSAPRADYAEAAVVALTTTGHEGKVYELAGDHWYTLAQLGAEVSRQTGKAIPYRNLSEDDYTAALVGMGLPTGLARAYAGWDVAALHGALFDDQRQLSKLIDRPTTTLSAVVADALKALRQSPAAHA